MVSLPLRIVENDDTSRDKNATRMTMSLENEATIASIVNRFLFVLKTAGSRMIEGDQQVRWFQRV